MSIAHSYLETEAESSSEPTDHHGMPPEAMALEQNMASPASTSAFPDISMQFLQDLDMDADEYRFMFQTPDNNNDPPSTASGSGDVSSNKAYPLLDGHENLNPETLGLTGDMDPYLLQRYLTDEHGSFKFKQLVIRSVNNSPPVQFLVSQPPLFSRSRQETGHQSRPTFELRKELEKVVPQNIGRRLLGLYKRFLTPHYPIFSDESPPDPATSPPCLLAAIYSISLPFAMYDDQLCIDMAYDSPDYKDLSDLINVSVASDIHSPTIATVQTLFLLVARPSSNPLVSDASYRWTTMGTLVSTAVNIGLHLDPNLWNIPLAQACARRRLSFFIFALDKCSLRSLARVKDPEDVNSIVFELFEALESKNSDGTRSIAPSSGDSMPGITIELGHHYTSLLILRAAVHSQLGDAQVSEMSDQQSSGLRNRLKTALEEFLDFVRSLKSDGTAEHWPPWCQSAFSSLCFTLLYMFVSAPTFEEASSYFALLESTRKHLRLKANALAVLRLSLLRIDAIFWRGIDQVLRLETHVKLALEATSQSA
ncbi:hypothetical protein FSARC_10829 [Fusarium sarcochroum]|uniref:Xylanolytic transcriptional activator regulatory domain-containing protein n=1 Tax=Fusarium sarcochroum TaxID=1208366 RepID=A0A8H4X318_9HYPO|nr:hypothetical protein FSARC_10829 [Fusarium sarcochroum]